MYFYNQLFTIVLVYGTLEGIMERVKPQFTGHLTNADFFNINKPLGMEIRWVGGQAICGFSNKLRQQSAQWHEFFTGINGVSVQQETQGPELDISNL